MKNFVVSARKYRPLGFDELVGQDHIVATLKNAIQNNQLAQSLLFHGPRGVGKTTCARIVARLINGFEEKSEVNPLNIFELDAASNNSVEDIRSLIDQVRYPPQEGEYKVYIIDEVHMLSNQAFNAFLKTLEEPPSYAIFILATTEKHKVIPTILSRCQIFDFNRIQISDIVSKLNKIADKEKVTIEEAALHIIAQKADGALRDALSIFDLMVNFSYGNKVTFKDVIQNLHILDYDYYFDIVDGLIAENHSIPLILLDKIIKSGFEGKNFIVGLSEHCRNLMMTQDDRTTKLLEVPENIQKRFFEQARNLPFDLLLSWINIANQCEINYKSSKNPRLLVELALMKMAHVRSVIQSTHIHNDLEQKLESKKKSKKNSNTAQSQISSNDSKDLELSPSKKEAKILHETNSSSRTTINLNNLSKAPKKISEPKSNEGVVEDLHFSNEELQLAWDEFANNHKSQTAEYQILVREFSFKHPIIEVSLINAMEEMLFENFKINLCLHLKNKLQNTQIQLISKLKKATQKNVIYTGREKFNFLADKNPVLRELHSRLELDWDF